MPELISVIIPTYNRAELITDAINSVLEQSYKNFEVLVIDDGSIDNTAEVVDGIKDKRVKYLYQANGGVSKARNTGIKFAKGRYIAFLDSDDLFHPQKLQKQAEVLDANLEVGIVTGSSQYKTMDGKEIVIKKYQAKNKYENLKYILTNPDKVYTGTPTLMIRKSCFDSVGVFDETLNFCEDWDIFFRVSMLYEVYNIKDIVAYVRVHNDSLSNSLSKGADAKTFKQNYLKFLEKSFTNTNLSSQFYRFGDVAYSNALWCVGSFALYKAYDMEVTRECLFASLKHSLTKLLNIKFVIALVLSLLPKPFLKAYVKLKKQKANLKIKNKK